ncbi:MAG: ABC transporter substrate-binding protein [Treponema sp.]|nr:ABC transporter substrate-binding protein [Treponema sp.]
MKYLKLFSFLILALCVVGCKKADIASSKRTITDMEGTSVVIPKDVNRVACISQSATDFMIAFGLGDKIAGTYRSFTYNPWTIELYPVVKNFKAYSYSVAAEELLADGIDLVITQNTENAESFRNAGIPVVAVHQYSPSGKFDDEMFDTARIIAQIFPQAKKKADAWIKEVQETIRDIELKIGTADKDFLVYYVNGEKSKGLYYSDGGNSMISRIYDIANIQLATEKYAVLNVHKVSDEEMVSLNPYAMMIGGAYQNNLFDSLKKSPVWSNLECYKNNRVYRIPVCMIGIENVGVETSLMLKYTASLFSNYDFDMTKEMKTCVKKYFNYELSDSDVRNMCNGLDKFGERMVK